MEVGQRDNEEWIEHNWKKRISEIYWWKQLSDEGEYVQTMSKPEHDGEVAKNVSKHIYVCGHLKTIGWLLKIVC